MKGAAVDSRVTMMLECMQECISLYGEKNVILDTKPTMNSKEIIDWYVSHSAFPENDNQKPIKQRKN